MRNKKKGWFSVNVVAPMGSLQIEAWFHGKITRNAAEYLLQRGPTPGSFIVRESQSQPGDFTLSFTDGSKVVHYRINKVDEGFNIGPTRNFPTIQDLIAHYRSNADGIACALTDTVPKAHAKAVVISKAAEKRWELKREDLELGKVLGSGNYGDVHEAMWKSEKTKVAVKTVKEDSMVCVARHLAKVDLTLMADKLLAYFCFSPVSCFVPLYFFIRCHPKNSVHGD